MEFEFEELEIEGPVLVRPGLYRDHRGTFSELYRRSAFRAAGIEDEFVQDNRARSRRGVLRGLHFQRPPHAQAKLLRVSEGEIFDVGVDLRSNSPDRGRWVARRLSAEGREILYLPEGFAHGYCVLSETAVVEYKTSAEYAPGSEGGIAWDDPALGIPWPVEDPDVSEKDASLPRLADAETGF